MFLFESQPISNWLMLFLVFGVLILLNEFSRRSKWGGIFAF